MKCLVVPLLMLYCIGIMYSQVGVNTTNPKALFDIKASDASNPQNTDGLLVPKLNQFPAVSPGSDQDGLLIYFLGNATNDKGFYYWNNSTTRWEPIVAPFTDADWFEEGTTTYPKNSTDDIYTQGNVAIGKTVADYKLDIFQNSGSRGINVDIGGAQTAPVYGNYISNYSNTTASNSYGNFNILSGSSGNELTATCNIVTSTSDQRHTGVANFIESNGNGFHKGINTVLGGNGNGNRYGVNNTIRGGGTGTRYAMYNDFLNNSTSGESFGLCNVFYGDATTGGSYSRYGVLSNFPLALTQSGDLIGVASTFDSGNNSIHYGVKNELRGAGAGTHYGCYNEVTNGTGTLYGVYSKVSGASNYAGFFEGKLHVDQAPIVLRDMTSTPSIPSGHSGLFSSGGELRSIDDSGNVNVISPHYFGLITPSHPMAWSFYSKNERVGQQINVDMMKAIQVIENLSGEKLIYLANLEGELIETQQENSSLVEQLAQQKGEIESLKNDVELLKRLIQELKK